MLYLIRRQRKAARRRRAVRIFTFVPVVSYALTYLFKGPDCNSLSVHRSFCKLMDENCSAFLSVAASERPKKEAGASGKIEPAQAIGEGDWANEDELPGAIACAGLACLDMQLVGVEDVGAAEDGSNDESIRRFAQVTTCAGGSAPQAAAALARLKVRGCCIARVADDSSGGELRRLLRADGAPATAERFINDGGANTEGSTSLAILPIHTDGSRGCFFELGANNRLSSDDVLSALAGAAAAAAEGAMPAPHGRIAALHFGYPHLLPHCSGTALVKLLRDAPRAANAPQLLVSLDLNGATTSARASEAVLPRQALRRVDVMHVNEEEGAHLIGADESIDDDEELFCRQVAKWAHSRGVAVLLLTLGPRGSFVATTPDEKRLHKAMAARGLPSSHSWTVGASVRIPAFALAGGPTATANANGAGDTFCIAFVAAMLWRRPLLTMDQATTVAALAAFHRVDATLRERTPHATLRELVATVAEKRAMAVQP